MYLERISSPQDLAGLTPAELSSLCEEIREFIVAAVSVTGGHLGSNLGAVELTVALHRVFDSPTDAILWDTGHQAYVHKILTGRREQFEQLRQTGGLSGYPSREESRHDFIENSHASTVLSYAYGMAAARDAGVDSHRHIVAVIGDGAMTGGLAYEALNNLGHSGRRVIVILNDNGRSYAPTISNLSANSSGPASGPLTGDPPLGIERSGDRLGEKITDRIGELLSHALTDIRLNPTYVRRQRRLEEFLHNLPVVGTPAERAVEAFKAGVREFLQPPSFFEALGVRYVGPVDGHDITALEQSLSNAVDLSAEGPIVVHVLTQKGRGYSPAEDDEEKNLHDAPVFNPATGPPKSGPSGYTQAFAEAILTEAAQNPRLVAVTAAMPGPTGLIPFQEHYPDRFFDVGIAEQHAVAGAAGMAMSGLTPVVAIYSTFLSRAWDQVVYDVALHRLGVIFCLDRAGITGPDGASHHGVYDMAMLSKVPGMRILAPSSAQELQQMFHDAVGLADSGPVSIRYPRGSARHVPLDQVGSGLSALRLRPTSLSSSGNGSREVASDSGTQVCILGIGSMVAEALQAAEMLSAVGIEASVWDVRSCVPLDPQMIADAATHDVVITVEDGIREGGIGMMIAEQITAINSAVTVSTLGVPTRFIAHASSAQQIHAQLGLDANGIFEQARTSLSEHGSPSVPAHGAGS
jgi:1-deoxy-D-xylulose-5-phosphate synthase